MTPLVFTEFCKRFCNVQFTPGQLVLYRVARDGIEPGELTGKDRELAAQIFGPSVETIPASARQVVAQSKGARVGGTRFAALGGLHAGLTLPMNPAPGEVMSHITVAPDMRLARQAQRYISGAVHDNPDMERLIVSETVDSLVMRRSQDGCLIEFICLPASQRGASVRGRSLFSALMSEAAFFYDENYTRNDRAVYEPLVIRLIALAILWSESTPHSETDLLNEFVEQNYDHPTTAIAARTPTLLMRDDAQTIALVERERERDPDNASREFDCTPLSAGSSSLFDSAAIKACIDEMAPFILEPTPGAICGTMGLDTAFRRDCTAGVIVRNIDGIYHVAEIVEMRPERGSHLVPSVTITDLLLRARHHRVETVACDQHYVDTVREYVQREMLKEAPHGNAGKIEIYTCARTLIAEGKVRICAEYKRLIAQLREVVSKPTPGGGITISSPRRQGSGHGDLVSAFVLALWAEHQNNQPGKRAPRITLAEKTANDRWLRPARGSLWR